MTPAAIVFLLVSLFAMHPRPGVSGNGPAEPATRVDSLLAHAQRWDTLGVAACVDRFALALVGTPYADGTLECPGPEACRITMNGFCQLHRLFKLFIKTKTLRRSL